jgi:hypothetical protein
MINHILKISFKVLSTLFILSFFSTFTAFSQKKERSFYQIKIYHLKSQQQEERVDQFLENAFLPAMNRNGVKHVGVFKPIKKDSVQKIYVFIPFKSYNQCQKIEQSLQSDKQFLSAGRDYIDSQHDNVPYSRIESIFLSAFEGMPQANKPALSGPKRDRVYELRSYEGPTEKYFVNKVQMFNKGDEIGIFNRLGFNAIFYGEVISGSKMPNLMYMTSFDNKAERDKHWKAFGSDPDWKKLSAMPEYKNNVSHIDITFLYPTEYSEL